MAGINSKPHENENLCPSQQPKISVRNYSSENSKVSIIFYIERKSVVKNWFHTFPNTSHISTNARLFWTLFCYVSSWLEVVLEHAILGAAENLGPVPVLGTGLSEEWHLAFWWGEQRPYWTWKPLVFRVFFLNNVFFFIISWRLITLQYCSGFCHTLKWISHGFTCVPHPNPPSHLPLHPIPLGLPSAPGPSTCLMHPTWAGDLFLYR